MRLALFGGLNEFLIEKDQADFHRRDQNLEKAADFRRRSQGSRLEDCLLTLQGLEARVQARL